MKKIRSYIAGKLVDFADWFLDSTLWLAQDGNDIEEHEAQKKQVEDMRKKLRRARRRHLKVIRERQEH